MSAVNLLITFAVAKLVGVVFSWIWVALSRDYTQALVYSSMGLSLLPGISVGIYMFIKGNYVLGVLLFVLASVSVISLWAWRERVPYAVEMLHTVALFIEAYPGPTRVAFVALVPEVFWQYFTALGLVLAALLYESVTLYLLLAFFTFSSMWVSGVIRSVLRVVSAGVCGVWYHQTNEIHQISVLVEENSETKDWGKRDTTPREGQLALAAHPTSACVKQAMTGSFGSVALAALLAMDWRTARAIFGSLRDKVKDSKSCFASCVRWVVSGLDRIIHYFNFYAYTQIGMYQKSYCTAASDTWRLLSARGSINILNDNLIGGILPLSNLVAGGVSLGAGLLLISVLERDYYLLAGILSFGGGASVMLQVMQVVESSVITIILCFAEHPRVLRHSHPPLYDNFKDIYGSVCDLFADEEEEGEKKVQRSEASTPKEYSKASLSW